MGHHTLAACQVYMNNTTKDMAAFYDTQQILD